MLDAATALDGKSMDINVFQSSLGAISSATFINFLRKSVHAALHAKSAHNLRNLPFEIFDKHIDCVKILEKHCNDY